MTNSDAKRRAAVTEKPDKPLPRRPYFLVEPDLLTPAEIARLRQRAKDNSAYYRKAFAHLRPENKKTDKS